MADSPHFVKMGANGWPPDFRLACKVEEFQQRLKGAKRWNRRRWLFAIAIGFVATCALFYGVWYVLLVLPGNAAEDVARRARAAGLPWTSDELNARIPDGKPWPTERIDALYGDKNSAFHKAMQFDSSEQSQAQLAVAGDPTGLAFLNDLDRVRYGNGKKDWDLFDEVLFPEMSSYRRVANWFKFRANWNAEGGRFEESLRDCRRIRAISHVAADSPTIIGQLVAQSMEGILYSAIESIVSQPNVGVEHLRGLSQIADEDVMNGWCKRGLIGEAYWHVSITRNLHRYGGVIGIVRGNAFGGSVEDEQSPRTGPINRSGIPSASMDRMFFVRSLEFWTPIIEAIQNGGTDEEIAAVYVRQDRTISPTRPDHALLRMMSILIDPEGMIAPAKASRQCVRALIRSHEFKLEKGRWPTSSQELGVAITDPYDNRPIRLSFDGKHFRVYSIGRNRLDDGGKKPFEIGPTSTRNDGDEVYSSPPIQKLRAPGL